MLNCAPRFNGCLSLVGWYLWFLIWASICALYSSSYYLRVVFGWEKVFELFLLFQYYCRMSLLCWICKYHSQININFIKIRKINKLDEKYVLLIGLSCILYHILHLLLHCGGAFLVIHCIDIYLYLWYTDYGKVPHTTSLQKTFMICRIHIKWPIISQTWWPHTVDWCEIICLNPAA